MIQARTLPGMMELLPEDQIIFNEMKDAIEGVFQNHGFFPLDTPAMENLEILTAKGGGETSKQIYEIKGSKRDIGLRFDLTVPLAKYVALYFSDLEFPFRRYHIGKVYRGERNQKGRYREFYQCDIDIIGHNKLSLYNDGEVASVMADIFKELQLDYRFHYNNRKLLNGFFESLGISRFTETLRIIDKLAKIGRDKVTEELLELGLEEGPIQRILDFIAIDGSNDEILERLKNLGIEDGGYVEGLHELEKVYRIMTELGVPKERIHIDLSITRGLDYYTGTVLETFLKDHENLGSICSGGRYDDLAGNYTKQKLPGVGLSIGLTRLFFLLQEENLLPKTAEKKISAMVLPMKGFEDQGIEILKKLRDAGKIVICHTESGKIGKKFQFADRMNIPYVIVIGEDEIKSGRFSLRDMETGDQEQLSLDKIIEKL
ncbi:MAG: histidine--tRNA ligase [Tissierellia bacterium]|nr:histidine--tRNA ligase [Tissierellia bacterium]